MTKEALKLATEMERGQFSTTLLPAAAELRRLHEENRKLKAQEALNKKAENARELGLDYEPEQEPCGGCGGSGWVSRDPDIGTDQECFVCEGAGVIKPKQEPVAWISTGPARMIYWKSDKPAFGDDWVPLYTTPPPVAEPHKRKPLTDEEAQQIFAKHNCTISTHLAGILARAIEAAHGIKGEE